MVVVKAWERWLRAEDLLAELAPSGKRASPHWDKTSGGRVIAVPQ